MPDEKRDRAEETDVPTEEDAPPDEREEAIPDPDEDIVTYASWESFPASDAPGWRA